MAITPVMAIAAMMTIFTTAIMVIRAIVANKIIMTLTGNTDSMAITAVMAMTSSVWSLLGGGQATAALSSCVQRAQATCF